MKEFWNGLSPIGRVGVAIMALSVPVFLFLPLIPFLSVGGQQKGALAFGAFVAAEVMFYSGAALAGKDAVQWIYGRFKRK